MMTLFIRVLKNTSCLLTAGPLLLNLVCVFRIDAVLRDTDDGQIQFVRHFERVYYDHATLRDHHVTKRSDDHLTFQFEAYGRSFTPVLRPDDRHLHADLVIETSSGRYAHSRPRVYAGHIKEDSSNVFGVLTKWGHFEGKISTYNETYFIERAAHHFNHSGEFHTIIYKLSDVTFESSHVSSAYAQLKMKQTQLTRNINTTDNANRKYIFYKYETTLGNSIGRYSKELNEEDIVNTDKIRKRRKRAVDSTKTICELYMQADHMYFQKYGSDVETVIEKLTQHVEVVDSFYKKINFDESGGADNIGFIIKKIKIWDDPTVAGYKYDGNFAVDYLLDLYSSDDYDQYCLSYLFTYRDFSNGVLGLAWIGHPTSAGGVCEKYRKYQGEGKSLNTGLVTLLNYGTAVPSAVSFVTFAHEIGHNFGSDHDLSNTDCAPGEPEGNYIMYARATSGLQPNNFKLSSCSITQIQPVLEAKARNSDGCFTVFTGAMCGNRVVEGLEECDCGWDDECDEGCCNPQVEDSSAPGVETPCTRKSTAVCSPSEGSCCTNACQYINDTVSCHAVSDCLDEAFCSSAQCPDSGSKPNATQCGDSEDFLVCYNGECSGSICLAHGREPCLCSAVSLKDEKLCQVCCKDGDTCMSSYELADIPDAEALAGQPCNDYQGYCDVFKICRKVDPEGPLSNLKQLFLSGDALNAMKEFLTKHWYIGLIFGLVFIISIALVVKVCSKTHKPSDQNNVQSRDVQRVNPGPSKYNQVAPNPDKVYPDGYI